MPTVTRSYEIADDWSVSTDELAALLSGVRGLLQLTRHRFKHRLELCG